MMARIKEHNRQVEADSKGRGRGHSSPSRGGPKKSMEQSLGKLSHMGVVGDK